ncbi:MAG: 30S ribosomal protein S6 [Phycisphaerae bacterium]|nr:30S ribosomal protein S6 [Phycisphaerae bacterium]
MVKTYEGMFLVSPVLGEGVAPTDPVQRILKRAEAEVLVCKKWDERKLAYEIRKQKRGTYVLTYFKADGSRIAGIERDVQLADDMLRVLILDAQDVTREQMEAPTPCEQERRPEEPGEGDGGDDRDRDRDRDRDFRPRGRRSDREQPVGADDVDGKGD